MTDEYLVEVKVKNNLIKSLMDERGITSLKELSRQSMISYGVLMQVSSLHTPLFKNNGEIRDVFWDLSSFFKVEPYDLVPERMYNNGISTNKNKFSLNDEDMGLLIRDKDQSKMLEKVIDNESIEKAMECLTKREVKCIEYTYGLNGKPETSMYDISKMGILGNITMARVNQIKNKALRKLKHPERREMLGYNKDGKPYQLKEQ